MKRYNEYFPDSHYESLLNFSQMVRNRLIFFLLFLVYLLLGILSTSDKMLYMETPIKMPLLNLDLPIISFYTFMPLFVLVLQFNLLYIVSQYKRRFMNVCDKYGKEEIRSLPFGLLEGAIYSENRLSFFLKVVINFLLFAFAPIILIFFYFRFTDYQDFVISSWNLFAVIISTIISGLFSPLFNSSKSKKVFIRIIISVIVLGLLYYHLEIVRVFTNKGSSFKELEKVYIGSKIIPKLEVDSEFLIPIDRDKLELLKDLDDLEDGKALLQYNIPFNQENRNFIYANFSNSIMIKTNFKGCDFRKAYLSGANFQEADLCRTNLQGADLSGTNLQKADLSEANLKGANLSGANLKGANLSRANLKGANLKGANLSEANLERANLKGALNIQNANLAGVKGNYYY